MYQIHFSLTKLPSLLFTESSLILIYISSVDSSSSTSLLLSCLKSFLCSFITTSYYFYSSILMFGVISFSIRFPLLSDSLFLILLSVCSSEFFSELFESTSVYSLIYVSYVEFLLSLLLYV